MASIFDKKKCSICEMDNPIDQYVRISSPFIEGDHSPICIGCLENKIDYSDMHSVDAFCRWANMPFIPDEWVRIYRENPANVLEVYSSSIVNGEYKGIDWSTVNAFWKSEVEKGTLFDNMEELKREFTDRMKVKWQLPAAYEEFMWLERFYREMNNMQNLNNPATKDILQKVCKIALQVDRLLKDSEAEVKDVKDLTTVYTNMLKTSGFLEASSGGANTVNSVAQLYQLMEKSNWQPTFYDGKAKDFADKTIDDMKKTMKRLMVGDGSIAEIFEAKLRQAGLPLDIEETDDATDVHEEISVLKAIQADRKKSQAPRPKNELVHFGSDSDEDD